MASSEEYKDFIVEQLSLLDGITARPMMGEFLLYMGGILFGGVYDDNLLIKKTKSGEGYLLGEAIPYPGAKSMFLIEDVDNREMLRDIVLDTCKDLSGK